MVRWRRSISIQDRSRNQQSDRNRSKLKPIANPYTAQQRMRSISKRRTGFSMGPQQNIATRAVSSGRANARRYYTLFTLTRPGLHTKSSSSTTPPYAQQVSVCVHIIISSYFEFIPEFSSSTDCYSYKSEFTQHPIIQQNRNHQTIIRG